MEVMLRDFRKEGDWLKETKFSCSVSQFVACVSFVGWHISESYCKCQLLNFGVNSMNICVFGYPRLDEIFKRGLIVYVEVGFGERF